MARNSEKAMTALARWRSANVDKERPKEHRPYLATECDDLYKAERFRRDIISEISKKVAQIQNAGLGEFKLRDLNDEINKLLREKWHWQNRIIDLNGPNYHKKSAQVFDSDGLEVPGNRGYKYFGASRDLPGVRELFQEAPASQKKKTRAELMKLIDAEYYGYNDDDDGILIPLEKEAEAKARAEKIEKFKSEQEVINLNRMSKGLEVEEEVPEEPDIYTLMMMNPMPRDDESITRLEGEDDAHEVEVEGREFLAHVPIPSQEEIHDALLRRKKQELLQQYAEDVLHAESEEAKLLLEGI